MESKNILLSKTLWVNILAVVIFVIQYYRKDMVIPVEVQASLLALINVVLRFVTNKPIDWS